MSGKGAAKDFYMSEDKRLLFTTWPYGVNLPKGAAYVGENILLGTDVMEMLYPGIKIDQKTIDSVLKGHHMSRMSAEEPLVWSVKEGKWVG